MTQQIDRLLAIMARLRDPESGCEWDRAQTFATIAPYTVEEAYEVSDAIERGHIADLRCELGDLLLQVVFHAQIATEAGHFGFDDVARAISDKMEARHPHIFGEHAGPMSETHWEEIKATERESAGSKSALDGIAKALPSLMRAEKLQKRAARVGFDWPDPDGPASKVAEELDELREAAADHRAEEAGDLLFAAVNLVRKYNIAPEEALKAANAKFERRFRAMEDKAGGRFSELSLEDQEEVWNAVKSDESPARVLAERWSRNA